MFGKYQREGYFSLLTWMTKCMVTFCIVVNVAFATTQGDTVSLPFSTSELPTLNLAIGTNEPATAFAIGTNEPPTAFAIGTNEPPTTTLAITTTQIQTTTTPVGKSETTTLQFATTREWPFHDRSLRAEDLGCFAFPQVQFMRFKMDDHFVKLKAHQNEKWNVWECGRRCSQLETYTYGGLVSQDPDYCMCFDEVHNLIKVNASECMCTESVKGNTKRILCPTEYSTIHVITTCPLGYYRPPFCMERAKSTCLDHQVTGFADALHDGRCQWCVLQRGETGWKDCDVLLDLNKKVTYSSLSHFQDMDDYIYSGSLEVCKHVEGVGISTFQLSDIYSPFILGNSKIYVHSIRARLMAPGATYFSIWRDRKRPVWQTDNLNTMMPPNVYNLTLLYKFLMDSYQDYWVQEYKNIDYLIGPDMQQDEQLFFGYHTLDTSLLAGTSSQDYRSRTCGIAGQAIKKPGIVGEDTVASDVFMRNMHEFDQIDGGGWQPGKTIQAATEFNFEDYQENDLFPMAFGGYYYYIPLEVKLLTACPQGCSRGDCSEEGTCTHGCSSGLYGPHCDQPCPANKFGQNCEANCSLNCVNQDCSPTTGICTEGCNGAWMGFLCNDTCPAPFWGPNCNTKCSLFCNMTEVCDPLSGHCDGGCKLGFLPPTCVDPCPHGTWGHGCVETCGHCHDNEQCDMATGKCHNGCEEPYMPHRCKCKRGTYGEDCENTCGECKNGPCHPETGNCPGNDNEMGDNPNEDDDPTDMCLNNTMPAKCMCRYGTWGENTGCDKECGHCKKEMCDSLNGTCWLGCDRGWRGDLCDEGCHPGYYGDNCALPCPMCADVCDTYNGSCPNGTCKEGWKSPECRTCADGFYGEMCDNECGHCYKNVPCDRVHGRCPNVDPTVDVVDLDWIFRPERDTPDIFKPCVSLDQSDDSDSDDSPTLPGRKVTTLDELVSAVIEGMLDGYVVKDKQAMAIERLINAVCEEGYQGPYCNCSVGRYGAGCQGSCGHCLVTCLWSGSCLAGCKPGYKGDKCDTECDNFHYGPNCAFSCGSCKEGTGCTKVDGICESGCENGFRPPECICPTGFFGPDCEHECGNCKEGTTCDVYTGKCERGCQAGFKGPFCNCSEGKYGVHCDKQCGHCLAGADCDFCTGECPSLECEIGYKNKKCDAMCDPGTYGRNCRLDCGQCRSCAPCDVVTGACPPSAKHGCNSGFAMPFCTENCPRGTYGDNCESICGNCYRGQRCNVYDGKCASGCMMGYQPPKCVAACEAGTFGYGCLQRCGRCAGGEACNFLDGRCPDGCEGDFYPPYCFVEVNLAALATLPECEDGKYNSPTCDLDCGKCFGGSLCHNKLGYCELGCEPGFKPTRCHDDCKDGHFGSQCIEICGHCAGDAVCDKTDGKCPEGCKAGWFGPNCKWESEIEYNENEIANLESTASMPRLQFLVKFTIVLRLYWLR